MSYNNIRLKYRNHILLVSNNIDMKYFLNRYMFRDITNIEIDNLYIENIKYIDNIDYLYELSLYRDLYITNLEYDILNILYDNDIDIHNRYNLNQFIYNHPIFNIDNIENYIKYRDKLYNICKMDIEYRNIIG